MPIFYIKGCIICTCSSLVMHLKNQFCWPVTWTSPGIYSELVHEEHAPLESDLLHGTTWAGPELAHCDSARSSSSAHCCCLTASQCVCSFYHLGCGVFVPSCSVKVKIRPMTVGLETLAQLILESHLEVFPAWGGSSYGSLHSFRKLCDWSGSWGWDALVPYSTKLENPPYLHCGDFGGFFDGDDGGMTYCDDGKMICYDCESLGLRLNLICKWINSRFTYQQSKL